jgi:hypothetical protein
MFSHMCDSKLFAVKVFHFCNLHFIFCSYQVICDKNSTNIIKDENMTSIPHLDKVFGDGDGETISDFDMYAPTASTEPQWKYYDEKTNKSCVLVRMEMKMLVSYKGKGKI